MADSFGARSTLTVGGERYDIFRLDALQARYDVARLRYTWRILLENVLRHEDGESVTGADVEVVGGPPGAGVCDQVALVYRARVVEARDGCALPDTHVGPDSQTAVGDGLGVGGWGVGGMEAGAAMLGEAM